MKTIQHLFTALLLLCTTAVAAHDFEVNGIYYDITNATNKTVSVTYQGDSYYEYSNEYTGSVVIPESVTYNGTTYSVTSIGTSAFNGCSGLTSVEIPNSVTSIGSSAFSGCSGLTSITIPNSVTSIGGGAFYNCTGLTSIEIPNSVTSIGNQAFEGTAWYNNQPDGVVYAGKVLYKYKGTMPSNTSTVIKEGTLGIAGGALYNCSGLTSIEIPNSVTSIGGSAFSGCSGLTSIEIPNSVTSIGGSAFSGCSGLTSVEIPNSVTSIGDDAFYGCTGLKTVINFSDLTFSKGSSNNGYVAYYADKVYNAPNGSIEGDFIFGKPNGVNTLLYYSGNATELTLPGDYKGDNYAIGASVFENNTTITSIEIPNSVTSIGGSAFSGCRGLTSVTIPNSVTSIGGSAFYGCSRLTSVTIPNSVTSIGNYAFSACSGLTSVVIPNSVTSIDIYTFYGCTGLTSIEIPNSVTSIGDYAFSYCSGLKTVINFSNLTFSKGSYGYGYVAYYADKVYNVPNGSIEGDFVFGENIVNNHEYTTDDGLPGKLQGSNHVWESPLLQGKTDAIRITVLDTNGGAGMYEYEGYPIVALGELEFYDGNGNKIAYSGSDVATNSLEGTEGSLANLCDGDYSTFYHSTWSGNGTTPDSYVYLDVKFPSEVDGVKIKMVGRDTKSLVPNHIKVRLSTCIHALKAYIGKNSNVVLPAEYKNMNYAIADNAFLNNTTIASVTIPVGVAGIGSSAFYGCSGLKNITIPNSVTSIGGYAFRGCTGLEKVCINDLAAWCGIDFGSADANPLHYAKNLYLNGQLLTSLTIHAEIAEVKDYAFYNCRGVINIDIVDGVKSIGSSAFYGCSDLETLYISNAIESIGDYAFAECNNILDIKIGSKKAIAASENIFSSDVYNNACLYVPEGRKFAYEKTAPWSNFYIAEMDFTGIDEVYDEVKGENGKGKTIYDLQGRKVEVPSEGLYIIDGKKVFIK